jgi:hypothetical protein
MGRTCSRDERFFDSCRSPQVLWKTLWERSGVEQKRPGFTVVFHALNKLLCSVRKWFDDKELKIFAKVEPRLCAKYLPGPGRISTAGPAQWW